MSLTHQELGNKLKLFFIDESSPGSIFWLPRGTIVFNRLIDYIKYYYQLKGYQEVVTPNIYDKSLWKTSGYWDKYRENMFIIRQDRYIEDGDNDKKDVEEKKLFSLKPINCGGHCLVFNKIRPSYKDLPVRLAEFGVLHRNEATGSLNGLFRVRRFQQDDSHIFCGMEHLKPEILEILKFIDHTYNLFGIKYKIYLSTRPEKYIGKKEVWDQAETILKECICEMTGKGEKKINIKEGDGAFYGPKIDIALLDKKKRENQCETVQLDFNLPSEERFNLKYTNDKMEQVNPIIIHRAILGSLEQFIGILLEYTQGKLPLWLSPRQIGITSVNKEFNEYASHIKVKIKEALPQVMVDFNDDTTEDLRNQIKFFEKMKYNIMLTVGKDEVEGNTVTVRLGKNRTTMGLADFIEKVKDMLEEYKL